MLKIENTEVVGWEAAIRGMRNPMNSWEKSDSFFCGSSECCFSDDECNPGCAGYGQGFNIGEADFDLMTRLRNSGTDHRKFMRMITVYLDITAPLYWWKEFDTYKVGTVANSCSTMHKIAAKEFTLEDFSHEHLDVVSRSCLEGVIHILNLNRDSFNKNAYDDPKIPWWQMIQLLPSSYNQKRTVMLNYEVLAGIYPMRKNHKLDEWVEFCKWIETLPYSEIIIGERVKLYADGKEINL